MIQTGTRVPADASWLAQDLQQIRDLLTDPGCWIQHNFAEDIAGDATSSDSEEACRWCLYGVIVNVHEHRVPEIVRALGFKNGTDLTSWNDVPERQHWEVLTRVDAAIANEMGWQF